MKIDTAVVLAGGQAERLKPLTEELPKGMIKICGKPLLQWIVEWLKTSNVKQIIFGVAYLKEDIISYFGDGSDFGVDIKYSIHTIEGGTAEGFRLAINRHIDQDTFFAMNGDQITELNLNSLAKFHRKHDSIATMVVTNPRCPYGHVRTNDKNEVMSFVEKPLCPHVLCSTGIYIFNHDILQYLPERGDVEKNVFPELVKIQRLKVYPYKGFFITVNTFKDLIEAEEVIKRKYG